MIGLSTNNPSPIKKIAAIDLGTNSFHVVVVEIMSDGSFRRIGSDDEITVDVRVICASQKDLAELCEQSLFREDLFHRLNVLTLTIPPLRSCKEGIPELAHHFIDRACTQIAGLGGMRDEVRKAESRIDTGIGPSESLAIIVDHQR